MIGNHYEVLGGNKMDHLRAFGLLLTKKFLPCDLDGCSLWFRGDCNFQYLHWLIKLRSAILGAVK